MAQIYKGDDGKLYRTRFQIGDVVRIRDVGQCYTTYFEAFQLLGIEKWKEPILLNTIKNKKEQNWIVHDLISVYNNYSEPFYNILYHIKNKNGISIVIGECGLNLRVLNPNINDNYKIFNNNKIINVIK